LKPDKALVSSDCALSFNQPKTLSGIETSQVQSSRVGEACFNQPKTLSGIETSNVSATVQPISCFNQPKTLSGIETTVKELGIKTPTRFNQPKTLSGIETRRLSSQCPQTSAASTNPKPFQGLKHLRLAR